MLALVGFYHALSFLKEIGLQSWDYDIDFLVVGTGAGGMAAAVTAKAQGLNTLLIEKSAFYGGTSALSGGVIWIPNNPHMDKANVADSEEEAFTYLDKVVSPDVDRAKLRAYIRRGPEMLQFIEQHSILKYDPAPVYPDYYAELPGGKGGARSLDPRPYSIRELGVELMRDMRVADFDNPNGFCMTAAEAHHFFSFTWRTPVVLFKCLLSYWLDIPARLRKWPDNRLTLGRALIGRLRKSLAQANVPLWLNTTAKEIIVENGKVLGLLCVKDGKEIRIRTQKGVLLATGGFAHNAELREQHHPKPTGSRWTATSRVDTGDGIALGAAAGAQLAMMDYVWWSPTMVLASGAVEAVIVGKSMPSCMVVNKAGRRFCNEAEPYEEFVKHQYAAHSDEIPSIPAYFVFDARHRKEYPIGSAIAPSKYKPDSAYKNLFESGWVKKADTLEELAKKCGIDPKGLTDEARKMAEFAASGVDKDFGKGATLNDRYYSDHRVKPNPCLAPLDQGPFYAVEIWPGDLGTKGGLLTNEHAEVLDNNHQVIEGLYATGNTTASVMGNSYPGAGSTLGPAMTFGYIAACRAAGKS